MIFPVYAYGQPVLKKKAIPIEKDWDGLEDFLANMWETMYHASGIGLAAPQVGHSIRFFIVDTLQLKHDKEEEEPKGGRIKQVFINAEKIEETGDEWAYEEGCLSIPDVRADVFRKETVKLRYYDENFELHEKVFYGINARVIQHEYDHIEGILFTDHLTPLKKRLLKKRLDKIKTGKVDSRYTMRFAKA